jgi:VanZ family protein
MLSSRVLQRLLWTLTFIYWSIIFALTHTPAQHLPKVKLNDKYEHLLAYGALGGLLFCSLWASRPARRGIALTVLMIGMAYGAVDEWLQALPFVHRDCSLADWFADVAGISIAVVVLSYLRRRLSTRPAKGARQSIDGSGTAPTTAAQVSGPADASEKEE